MNERYRGRFHLTPPFGWMNDPNGFSWFDGAYHLFYQYHPYDVVWGPMHWGHAVSQDLVAWETIPPALAPSESYDWFGCFSGTAVEADGRHVLLYTGVSVPDPDQPSRTLQVQCLAIGDGRKYKKSSKNPVIGADLLPPGASHADFRDPKLWKSGNHWYALVASRAASGRGQLLLFRSSNLTEWAFVGITAKADDNWGLMWECPDLFELDGRQVLLWSIQNLPSREGRFQNVHPVVYQEGLLNEQTGEFQGTSIIELDSGTDFYAPQTILSPDGRRILVAWMNMWERSNASVELGLGWNGAMTIPRELTWKGGRLCQWPIRELESYRQKRVSHQVSVSPGEPRRLEGVGGTSFDLVFRARIDRANRGFSIRVLQNATCETVLSYDPETELFQVDRTRSGHRLVSLAETHPEAQIRTVRCPLIHGELTGRILIDQSSLEVFLQEGLYSLTFLLFPNADATGLVFSAMGAAVDLTVESWTLEIPHSKERS